MSDMEELGQLIGRAMRSKETTAINVNEPNIHLDAQPIADAVVRGSEETAKALSRALGTSSEHFARSLAQAIDAFPAPADNVGIEERIGAVAEALKRNDIMPAVQLIVAELVNQTKQTARLVESTEDLALAMRENTLAIRADRTITDAKGNTLKMKVGA